MDKECPVCGDLLSKLNLDPNSLGEVYGCRFCAKCNKHFSDEFLTTNQNTNTVLQRGRR